MKTDDEAERPLNRSTRSSIAFSAANLLVPLACSTGVLMIWPAFLVNGPFGWQFLQEAARCAGMALPYLIRSRHHVRPSVFCARVMRDVEQAPLFIDRSFHLRTIVRKHSFLDADEIDVRVFESLGSVERDEGYAISLQCRPDRLPAHCAASFIEKTARGLRWTGLVVIEGLHQLQHGRLALKPFIGRLAAALEILNVSDLGDQVAQDRA
jgi:hypothetical protein